MAGDIHKERLVLWRIFKTCMENLTTQNIPELIYELFRYTYAPSKSKYENTFYKWHPEARGIAEIIRNDFQTEIISYGKKVLGWDKKERRLHICILNNIINGHLAEYFEMLLPDLNSDLISTLSGEKYEGKDLTGKSIVILTDSSALKQPLTLISLDGDACIRFTYPNVHAVRKQLEMCTDEGVLAIVKDGDMYKTKGIVSKQAVSQFPSIQFTKNIGWELYMPSKKNNIVGKSTYSKSKTTVCVFKCHNGKFVLPVLQLEHEFTKVAFRVFRDQDIAKKISKIICCATMSRKGRVLIFGSTQFIQKETLRLAVFKRRGAKLETPIDLLSHEGDKLLSMLANIDGALLIDENGYCYATGVILDSVAVKGAFSRGARYNCTKSYIESSKRGSMVLGIVVSDDGMVDYFSR